ncbi:thiopeptide-type bacteriocin biosynthesis protein [Micromonospora sp. M71_S20]|uniref:lantibiotic dehydratase n=1 Tax=Micromonospora sp. M71_S20 TaxID=592872 RepID=UPI000EB36B3E|nr:lantibiotic dehydratase [Micromonospora sp. M71_S20]RLK23786.1 thiopeptide-type bacteriocin biosynthesis protein [Micromonospora sp. M71_S20]
MVPAAGAALIRIAAYPKGLVLPAWPDLAHGHPDQWREWLDRTWRLPGFAAAVTCAAPQLADQIQRALSGEPVPQQRLRRLVQSAVRYLLRWTTRATPFGTFAGVAPVQFGVRAAVRLGEAHRVVSRPDGQFIAEHTARAEQDLAALRAVAVVTNSLGYRRGDRWVLPCAHASADRRWDVEIRLTGPIRAAIQAARSPVRFAELAATVAGPASVADAERLLAELVHKGVLLSALRPPMTATDPAPRVARHYAIPEPGSRVAVDLRADITVTLPPPVLHEAERAASTLVAVAPPQPAGWTEYHNAFIERWGPGAAVPIRDVLNVLGFPAGYRRSTRRAPALFTARDRLLGQLAQQAALDGCAEVVLNDALIDRLHGDDDRPPIPHTELRFTLAADTPHDLDRGAFTLTVLSGSRHAGVAAARFLHLLTPAELAGFQQVYRNLPTALPGAATVQLSGPPLDVRLTAVARVPELLPVLPLGDFHPAPPWTVEDLAVTGDGRRLWLVSLATGQPVEPLLFNSVLLPTLQQPLMRFLAEIWIAWTAPCSRFDWGHASGLPFLPRLRRGRTIVHPARWIIDHTALPASGAAWPQWRAAWQRHRHQRHIPQQVLVGDDDIRLRLDLDDHAHLAALRDHLDRRSRTVLAEAPGPAGWIDGRPAELLLTLTHPAPATRPARPARTATTVQHWPGRSGWLEARLHGRLDDILADLAGRPADYLPAGWWFLRYPDPEPHLRLRIPLPDIGRFADSARHLAGWVQHLHDDAVVRDYSLHPYRPETRHGAAATLAAAERVFAADSRAALHRLTGDRQAATAAGMIAIADGFTGDGPRWLATHAAHRTGPRLEPAQLEHARRRVHDEQLAAALAGYRSLVVDDGLDPDEVLGDLLHLHHARMIGVDLASERHCLRLARTIARTTLAGRKP